MAHVSRRTVDYYTQMGLIEAKRSHANHRYYTKETVRELQLISKYKQQHLTLSEIKEKVQLKKTVKSDKVYQSIEKLCEHMKTLDDDFVELQSLIKTLDEEQRHFINKQLGADGNALLQSWTLLLQQLS